MSELATHVAVPYIAAPFWLTSRTHWSWFDRASYTHTGLPA